MPVAGVCALSLPAREGGTRVDLGGGTLDDPITVQSYGEERYLGCTGCPVDSHPVIWLTVSKDRPIERCPECGGVYKMNYLGPEESHDHHHGDHRSPPPNPAPAFWNGLLMTEQIPMSRSILRLWPTL